MTAACLHRVLYCQLLQLRLRDIFAAHVGVGTPALAFFHRRWQLVFESVLKLVGAGRVCVFSIVVFVYVVRLWFAVFSGRQLCAVFVIHKITMSVLVG